MDDDLFQQEILQFELLDCDLRYKKEQMKKKYVSYKDDFCGLIAHSQKQLHFSDKSESLKS